MTARHAAALALVGWYLMVPPEHQDRIWGWYYRATGQERPLSDWELIESYDSLSDCQQLRRNFQGLALSMRTNSTPVDGKRSPDDKVVKETYQKLYERVAPNIDAISDLDMYFGLFSHFGRTNESKEDQDEETLSERWMSIRCIATDDPRLKGN